MVRGSSNLVGAAADCCDQRDREARLWGGETGDNDVVPFYEAPNETPEQKRRRLHLMATVGGSLAPRGTYGLPSAEQVERSRAARKGRSRRARLAGSVYWIASLPCSLQA